MFFERAREDAEKEVAADEKNSLVRWVTCVVCLRCVTCDVRCVMCDVHGRSCTGGGVPRCDWPCSKAAVSAHTRARTLAGTDKMGRGVAGAGAFPTRSRGVCDDRGCDLEV